MIVNRRHLLLLASVFCLAWLCGAGLQSNAIADNAVFFESNARAVLKTHCWHCHGEEEEIQAGLDLRLVRTMISGGDSGAAVVANNSAASLLLEKIQSGEMPPTGKRLSEAEIELLRSWIDQGAQTARPEPETFDASNFWTEEERSHWAFQPVRRPTVPAVVGRESVRTPIDAFVLAELEKHALSFSQEADRWTLLRRLTFDLHGLPPSLEQINQFLHDESPLAYEELVERLLAAPAYGERWARHWLDTAGYADSDGYNEVDRERLWSYRYRDYVIRAFNSDKPIDQFVIEQLAGDELVKQPFSNLSADDCEKLVATGFLRQSPDGTGQGEADPMLTRNDVVAETIKIATSSLLGLTVGCAQCHNHRYDPISQVDYFRLRALFEPALDSKNWRNRPARLVSTWQDEEQQLAAKVDAELAEIEGKRVAELDTLVTEVFEKEVAKLPEEQQDLARQARSIAADQRSAEQLALMKDHPSLNVDRGSVYLYEPTSMQEFNKKYETLVAETREKRPPESFIDALTEVPGQIPTTYLFSRGDYNQPREPVEPGDLSVLPEPAQIPSDNVEFATTGRRLGFAKHLTNGQHPLLGRVIVNRMWMHHFGRGIVATPSDFGVQGERPSHPELLDWLASELVRSGWSLKHLHRTIVTSATYRQRSQRRDSLERIDPDNRLLGRMNVRRLEAEAIRDAMIAVTGLSESSMFGPPEPVNPDEVGQVIIGQATRDGNGILVSKYEDGPRQYRRSIYVQVRRSQPLGVLEPFDLAAMTPNCDRRSSSTVAPQALLMMNNRQTVILAERFAKRLTQDIAENRVDRIAEQTRRGWLLALGSAPSTDEIARATELISAQLEWLLERDQAIAEGRISKEAKSTEMTPEVEALSLFCQALFSANPFLYVD